jgi:hypothetical protein
MTEPSPTRPVPGPPRPGPAPAGSPTEGSSPASETPTPPAGATSFVDLAQRPVAEHVGVFEAEHARLQRELGTIDQL